jgi:hypothetical protein
MAEREHLVAAYEDPDELVACVVSFVAELLENGLPVVTISRPAHRRAVDDVMANLGVDPVGASRDGALVTLDAEDTMSLFMVEGRPDPFRFAAVVASLVPIDGGPVSAFGVEPAGFLDSTAGETELPHPLHRTDACGLPPHRRAPATAASRTGPLRTTLSSGERIPKM